MKKSSECCIIGIKKNMRKKNWQKLGIHLTAPPKMEGKVKNAKMNPIKKAKKKAFYSPSVVEPVYLAGEDDSFSGFLLCCISCN